MTSVAEEQFEEWGLWKRLTRRKLRNYLFLNKKLQFNFALLLAVVGGVNAFYFSALFYFYSGKLLYDVAQYLPEYVLEDLLNSQYQFWTRTVIWVLAFEIIMVILLGLFFSHRIAGPLYAMAVRLRDIAKGATPRFVRLRKNDLLTEFADDLNEAITALRSQQAELAAILQEADDGKIDSVKARLRKLTTSAQEPGSSLPGETPPPSSA